jgi:uncharacterized repeat protein (TIGR03943 family)
MTAGNRFLSSGVLAVWGAVLTYFVFSGRVGSYLHPAFHIWTVVSGIVLLLMAAALWFIPQAEDEGCCGCDHDHGHDHNHADSHDHDHSHGGGLTVFPAMILVVPLLAAAVISPSQFGATVVANRGFVQDVRDLPGYQPFSEPPLPTEDGSVGPTETQPSSSYLPRNAKGQITAQTIDLLYAAEEPTMREDFDNKAVEMIGQILPAKTGNATGNRFNLVRMFVMCCAADARPVAVTVETNTPADQPEMSWVRVTGKATFPVEGGRRVPVVVADSVTACDPPDDTFIY